jgi:hypothetical protein
MIESIDNTIQMAVAGLCAWIALYRAVRSKERAWALLGLFSGIFCLGDFYWLLFLVFYGKTPLHYSVSELSWYTSYLFLLLLIIYVRVEICGDRMLRTRRRGGLTGRVRQFPPVLWCVPVFTAGMCVFYMQRGDYLSNILAAVFMTGLLWHALSGLISLSGQPERRGRLCMLYSNTILFCLAEYALWTSSCFWMGDTIANVYYWFDLLLTVTFVLYLPALRKAVAG